MYTNNHVHTHTRRPHVTAQYSVPRFDTMYTNNHVHTQATRDIRNYVRKGFKRSGTVIFVGGDLEVKVMNDVFNFAIHPK